MLGRDGQAKSTNRLWRVCGFTRYPGSSDSQKDSIQGDYFHVLDLVATLLLVNKQVSLAFIRVTDITLENGSSVESIAEEHFNKPGVMLSGQILQLECNLER
ncbi:hypothetical protein FRC12_008133 [Ceratobasidium sp. 428]|nr:hypothetical protein FRC12_008133 [Ceratobasidium sp. 428]